MNSLAALNDERGMMNAEVKDKCVFVHRSAFIIHRFLLCLLMFVAVTARAQEQPSANVKASEGSLSAGIITGRIVSDDGRPLPDAVIYFNRVFTGTPEQSQSVSTDSDGKFQTRGLPSGLYAIYANLPGFVIAPDAGAATGETKYYRPGDSVTLTLIKGGVITGTVKDANGEPVVAVAVRATRVRDAMGRPLPGGGFAQPRWTDDRGIYRFYGLQPGTYIVSAGGGLGRGWVMLNAYENDVPTYFPSSTRDTAAEVTVRGGEEASGTDIRYRGERGHSISGIVSGAVDSNNPFGINITLAQASSGASEATTFISPNLMKLGFSFSGVSDGEYEVFAQQGSRAGESVVSTPRHITIKGTDVTGLELSLTPLASIAGHVFLEAAPKESCADKSGAKLIETLINARRDEKARSQDAKAQAQETSRLPFFSAGGSVPNDQGEFTIRNLMAGSYRMTTRLPSNAWYVRFITLPGAPAAVRTSNAPSKSAETRSATMPSILTLKTGERITGVAVQIAQDAANLRGRVVAATEGVALPANLKVYLVPQERERVEDVLRYGEATINSDGTFALQNLAPGHYFIIARPIPESELSERTPRPLLWDAEARAKLRREAEAAKTTIELQPCQRATDYSLRYAPTQVTTNP
jgi:hypothetical protein